MSNKTEAGKEITAEQADKYLKKYDEVRGSLHKEVIPLKKEIKITKKERIELNA